MKRGCKGLSGACQNTHYVVVNPFESNRVNGVTSYTRNLLHYLQTHGIAATCLWNDKTLSSAQFREHVANYIADHFEPASALIEAPETGASTLLVPDGFRIHIRMHCPSAIVQLHQGRNVDRNTLAEQLRVIRETDIVSSPSYALLDVLGIDPKDNRFHVFKHGPPPDVTPTHYGGKAYDLMFLARFDRAKGIDFLNPVLESLPSALRVIAVGREAKLFEFSPRIRCRLEVHEHAENASRLRLIERSKIVLMLSRFENCPMTVLESLAAHSVVVAWDVGGIAEIAPPPMLRLAPFADTTAIVGQIMTALESRWPDRTMFELATDNLTDDFHRGFQRLLAAARGRSGGSPYRGLSCRGLHSCAISATRHSRERAMLNGG